MSLKETPIIEYKVRNSVVVCQITVLHRNPPDGLPSQQTHHGYGNTEWEALKDALDQVLFQEQPGVTIIDPEEPQLPWLHAHNPEDHIRNADADYEYDYLFGQDKNQKAADTEL